MSTALCDATNIPKSPGFSKSPRPVVKKTFKRGSSNNSKRIVCALATTYVKAAEIQNVKANANITPTRQKRKRDNLKLDMENEMKTLQDYFKDVDQCELKEEVRSTGAGNASNANASDACVTPRKTTTRAPWLTPEDKQFSTPLSKSKKENQREETAIMQSPYAKHAAQRDAENAEPARTRRTTQRSTAGKLRRV